MNLDALFGLAALYICGFAAWCIVVGGLAAQSNAAHAGRMVARAILAAPAWPVALPLLLMWMGRPASWWPSASSACGHERRVAELSAELARLRQLRADDGMDLSKALAEIDRLRAEREGYR